MTKSASGPSGDPHHTLTWGDASASVPVRIPMPRLPDPTILVNIAGRLVKLTLAEWRVHLQEAQQLDTKARTHE